MKTAVICAWRKGETDLDATIDSAVASIGKHAKIILVEDKDGSGPARTRHRGIMAAEGCDVIIIIDAHMRFSGNVLKKMAKAANDGALVCPLIWHNEACDFTGNPYAGARIVYRAKDGATHNALAGKWSKDTTPGLRSCVMGGAYAFRRQWYMVTAGQPLAMLPGWGGDEEALSIAAWISSAPIKVIDGKAAHRYRVKTPWKPTDSEFRNVRLSRMALINAFVTNEITRAELKDWQRRGVPEGIEDIITPEVARVRFAMSNCRRNWEQWYASVCESEEIDGIQAGKAQSTIPASMPELPRPNYGADETGRRCHKCNSARSEITNTRHAGRVVLRYRKCADCGARRVGREIV
jgi:glycosyltransferase involved in cell wall biosynthesis